MENQGPRNAFPLRLPRTTREQATQLAQAQGISLNEFIMLALGEKIIRLDQNGSLSESKTDVSAGKQI